MKIFLNKNNYLRIKVIPRSKTNEIIEIIKDDKKEETIKIRIKAPPEKNKANQELIKFLSKELQIPKSNFKIISGKHEQIKLIKIENQEK